MVTRALIQIEFSSLHYNHQHKHAGQNHPPIQITSTATAVTEMDVSYSRITAILLLDWQASHMMHPYMAERQAGEVPSVVLLMLVGMERFNCPGFSRIPSPLYLLLPCGAMCPVRKHASADLLDPCKNPSTVQVMSSLLHLLCSHIYVYTNPCKLTSSIAAHSIV